MDFYLGLLQIIGVHTMLGLSAYCVLLTREDTRVTHVRDYRYARYIMRDAEAIPL